MYFSRKIFVMLSLISLSSFVFGKSPSVNLTKGWKVLREYSGETLPDKNESWKDFSKTLSRKYRTEHPYEPGMEIWMKNTFKVPASLEKQKYLIISIGNRRIIEKVFINGHKLQDVGKIQLKGAMPSEFEKTIKSDKRGFLLRNFTKTVSSTQLWDVPALFLVENSMLTKGTNTITCQLWEVDAYNEYLNEVELRVPGISDLFFPMAYSRPDGDTGNVAVVRLRKRVPLKAELSMKAEIQDRLGKVLRVEQRKVKFNGKNLDITLKPKSSKDYKAVVTFSWRGQKTEPLWAYYMARLTIKPERQSFSLRGAWEYRGISEKEKNIMPPPSNDWRSVYIPGLIVKYAPPAHWKGKHRCYVKRKFKVPPQLTAERLLLRLGCVIQKGDIYINGRLVGVTSVNDSPAEFDVTDYVDRNKDNEICIILTDWSAFLKEGTKFHDGQVRPPKGTALCGFALNNMMGIANYVELVAVPQVSIKRIWITTSVSKSQLTVKTWLANRSKTNVEVEIHYTVNDKNKQLLSFNGKKVIIPANSVISTEITKKWENPILWSLHDPNLCMLSASLTYKQKKVDTKDVRFGFREISKTNKDIFINGKKINLRGASEALNSICYPKDAGLFARHLQNQKARGLNLTRVRGIQLVPSILWDIHDELGFFTNAESSLDDMGIGGIAYDDMRLHDNGIKELKNFILEYFNHPSILYWEYSNETMCGRAAAYKTMRDGFAKVVKAIKEFDPTRFVSQNGAWDFEGADVYNPHYPKKRILPNELYYIFDPINNIKDYTPAKKATIPQSQLCHPGLRYWDGKKLLVLGEFSWLHEDQIPGNSYRFFGDAALKPSPIRAGLIGPSPMISCMAAFGYEREMEFKALRIAGVRAFVAHSLSFVANRNTRPIIAMFMYHNSRFWANKPFKREIVVFNDSEEKKKLDVILSWKIANKKIGSISRKLTLPSAEQKRFTFTIPEINVDKATEVIAELKVKGKTVPEITQIQKWTIFPTMKKNNKAKIQVGLFDPENTLNGLFDGFNVNIKKLSNLNNLRNINMLVVAKDIDPNLLLKNKEAALRFVKNGGTALIMMQKRFSSILPFELKEHCTFTTMRNSMLKSYGALSIICAKTHPIFKGLLSDDLRYWAGDSLNLVYNQGIKSPVNGNIQVLSGLPPECATLIEADYGKGRFIINSLELTPQKIKSEPAASKLIENIIQYSCSPAFATGKTLVIATEKSSFLKNKLHLIADFCKSAPTSIEKYSLIILGTVPKDVLTKAFATKVRNFILNGGNVLVEQPDEKMCVWLELVSKRKIIRKKHIARRIVQRVVNPLLNGIGDNDLAWKRRWNQKTFDCKKTSSSDLMRYSTIAAGGLALTTPAALSTLKLGKGKLIINQIRWAETIGKRGIGHKGLRVEAALLKNSGARFSYPPSSLAENTLDMIFSPVDISKACNRSRTNISSSPCGGWIDLKEMDLSTLSSGRQYFNGILFNIINQKKNQRNSCIMLSPDKTFSAVSKNILKLPDKSKSIIIGKTADYIYFLHTSAYLRENKNTPVFTYQIRYKGFSKLIPGQDLAPYIEQVPIKAKVDVDDWMTDKGAPSISYAWEGAGGGSKCYLYFTKWRNPKPEIPIESIQVLSMNNKCIPIVLGITIGKKTKNMFTNGDIKKIAPCGAIIKEGKRKYIGKHKDWLHWHSGWSGNAWKKNSSVEVCTGKVPGFNKMAMRIKTISGPATGQIWFREKVSLVPEKTYTLSVDYLGEKNALGKIIFYIKGNNPDNAVITRHDKFALSTKNGFSYTIPRKANGVWRRFTIHFKVKKAVKNKFFIIQFQNRGKTPEDVFYFNNIQLQEISEE